MVVHLYSRTNIRSDHAHTYTCVHEYVCTCAFLPRLFFNAFMPTAKELSGISRRKSGTLCLRRLTFSLSFALLFYHPALTYDSPGCSLSPGRLAWDVLRRRFRRPSPSLRRRLRRRPTHPCRFRSCCCCCRCRCRSRWQLYLLTYVYDILIRHSFAARAKFSLVHKLFTLSAAVSLSPFWSFFISFSLAGDAL